MAETASEKILKDTLRKMKVEDRILYWQKVTTPMYQAKVSIRSVGMSVNQASAYTALCSLSLWHNNYSVASSAKK